MTTGHDLQCQEGDLIAAALTALRETTGVEGRLVGLDQQAGMSCHADAMIELRAGERNHRYHGECKATVDRMAALALVKAQLETGQAPGLLIASYLTADMADRCRALGLEFIDAVGNAYLNAPGLYVFVKGQKAVAGRALAGPQRGGGNATALRMIFALLCHPELVHAPYREIVKAAGIALGAVGWVFHDFTRRGLMSGPDKTYGRRWLEPGRMLDEWVTNYPIKLRPKLNPRRFRAPDPQWWQEARFKGLDAWWGGEVAADHLTGLLKPATQTLYVKPETALDCLQKLVRTYRLRPDPAGPIEILDAFWMFPVDETHPGLVPSILVYADLMATLDSRNIEVARMIRERIINDALGSN
jgi:hypothetical protein